MAAEAEKLYQKRVKQQQQQREQLQNDQQRGVQD